MRYLTSNYQQRGASMARRVSVRLVVVLSVLVVLSSGVLSAENHEAFLAYSRDADALLTRGEASELIVKAFGLPLIYPLRVESDVQKKFEYTDTLAVIDESFVVSSAQDIALHRYEPFIEGLIKVRAVSVDDGRFYPDEPITADVLSEIVAKVVFGVEGDSNTIDRFRSIGIEPPLGKIPITRGEAVEFVKNIVLDPAFSTISILVTSDIHGHVVPYYPGASEYAIGGIARMAQFVKDTRLRRPGTLLVDLGDAPYNTNVANLFEGLPVIESMNHMGYDAMVLGNHDFDFPFTVLERNARLAEFPFLSANTYHNGQYPEFLLPWVIKEVDGVRVAFVGLTDHSSAWYTHPRNVAGITFENHFDAAQRVLEALQGQADIYIALAHLHGDNRRLGEVVPGYDFVFGGGTDIVAFPEKFGDAWLIYPGKHAEVVNLLNINVWNKEVLGFNFAHVFMSENLPEDAFVRHLVDYYVAQLDERMADVVGYTEVDLDGERGTVRLKESNLANLIADSLRYVTGADIAIQNGGGVRASISQGAITINDIYTALPFDNVVVMVEMTGKTLWDTLEHGVSWYPSAAGGFLQVSGLEYVFDASREVGNRIQSVTINGKPIDLEKTYRVAANDFLTGGGDMFTMLRDDATVVLTTKFYLRDALLEYLTAVESVAPQTEGRITIINPVE